MKSDYRYSAQVARQEAERALDDADWVTSRLTSIPDREFKSNIDELEKNGLPVPQPSSSELIGL